MTSTTSPVATPPVVRIHTRANSAFVLQHAFALFWCFCCSTYHFGTTKQVVICDSCLFDGSHCFSLLMNFNCWNMMMEFCHSRCWQDLRLGLQRISKVGLLYEFNKNANVDFELLTMDDYDAFLMTHAVPTTPQAFSTGQTPGTPILQSLKLHPIKALPLLVWPLASTLWSTWILWTLHLLWPNRHQYHHLSWTVLSVISNSTLHLLETLTNGPTSKDRSLL